MAEPSVERLGRFLMEKLRDPAIEFAHYLASGNAGSQHWRGLEEAVDGLDHEQLAVLLRCVAACIDVGIYSLLEGVEEERGIGFMADGRPVRVRTEELQEELYGKDDDLYALDNWFTRYSRYPEAE